MNLRSEKPPARVKARLRRPSFALAPEIGASSLNPFALMKSNRRSLNTPGLRTNAPTGMACDPSTAKPVCRDVAASKNVSRRLTY